MHIVLTGSGRLEKIRGPLERVGHVCHTPSAAISHPIDAVICDVPGTSLLRASVLKMWFDSPLIFRLRGNYWQEISNHILSKYRAYLFDNWLVHTCDAICVPDPYLEKTLSNRTAFDENVRVIGVPKDVTEFPHRQKIIGEFNLLTLTNFSYWEKVDPLFRYADAINNTLDQTGGTWFVCGDGEHASDFDEHVSRHKNIRFEGFVDPKDYLANSDLLLHLSEFDISFPNAVLEGMAAGLPVILSDFEPFRYNQNALRVSTGEELQGTIKKLSESPSTCRFLGARNRQYVLDNHSPSVIGEQLSELISTVV